MASKASSRVLIDHDEIRRWAEERGAKPAVVKSTASEHDIGILRLDFPGYSGEDSLEEVSWDEWFKKFDKKNLALVVQDETADGKRSNFNKIVSRDSVEAAARSERSEGSSSDRTSRSSKKAPVSARDSSESKRTRESTSASGSRSGRTRKSTGRKAA
jgi:hypothetical protein